jgi:hypothetical protein
MFSDCGAGNKLVSRFSISLSFVGVEVQRDHKGIPNTEIAKKLPRARSALNQTNINQLATPCSGKGIRGNVAATLFAQAKRRWNHPETPRIVD